ncbi:MAG TPA: tetratricopeptide repeat protein [Vicinamibacterales bacterium]|nr:tetratricopeptide repeat protein [Vicinamibacterales bacterium]
MSSRARLSPAVALLLLLWPASVATAGLTSPDGLVKTYELILAARFDEAEGQLKSACPPAPRPACDVIGAVNDYWRLMLNPEETGRDAALLARINTAINAAEAWVVREPKRAEAWFYLGGAYGTRVLLRGHRGQYLAAARDGKRIHDSLQLAISLDPTIGDAYFGLGLYHYYAAIAPRAARILSTLMFLPGGDRAGGLKEMEQTRSKGLLLRGEADYQLHLIYLWYERQAATALRLIDGLHTRYPTNPVFFLRLADVQSIYIRNHQAALQTYRAMLDAARAGRIAAPALSEIDARLGMAHEMDAICDSAGAIDQLNAVIALTPAAPYGALARAHYQLGLVHDRAGRRADAIAAYQRARTVIPSDDRLRMRESIRAAIARAPAPRNCR